KRDGRFHYSEAVSWEAKGKYASLADGAYTIGFRPHHLTLAPGSAASVRVAGKVVITEISGSESVIHMRVGSDTWVSLSHGIHPFRRGQGVELFVQTDRCFYFDQNERLVQ
ncbi:MAG: TOBE domain-containing protein, partial [Gammaproteobacteria bacterium]|nr:TOBE domain-containing protein [Gammaproteobacteria bacterium]